MKTPAPFSRRSTLALLVLISSIAQQALAQSTVTVYSQNFDAYGQSQASAIVPPATTASVPRPAGWRVWATTEITNLRIVDGSVGTGSSLNGYLGTANGSDYSIGFYTTSLGTQNGVAYTFTNNGPTPIVGLQGSFDVEAAYSRFTALENSRTVAFHQGLSYKINPVDNPDGGSGIWGTAVSVSPALASINNANVEVNSTWFTDAQQDARSLSLRNRTFNLPVTLNQGDSIVFYWKGSYLANRHMNLAIDNFVLQAEIAAAPSAVFVDDDFSQDSSPGHTWGVDAFSTIQAAVNAVADGGTVNVASGTYDEQIVVNKSVSLVGATVPSKPILRFSGTVAGKLTLIDVAASNVGISNFKLEVDQTKLNSAIIASRTSGGPAALSGLQISGNEITAVGSSVAGPIGSFGVRNAISVNYAAFRNAVCDNSQFTISNNTVSATPAANPASGGVARIFRAGISVDDCYGTISGNTITSVSQDIEHRFCAGGPVVVSGNTVAGGGIEIAEPNPGATTIAVENNTFDGALGSTYTSSLRIKNNNQDKPVTVEGNTFSGHNWGISLENFRNVTLTKNSFTPAAASTTYRHITINTKSISSNSGSIVQVPIAAVITENVFVGSGAAGGRALAFYNHDSDNAAFGDLEVEGNSFDSGIAEFIHLDQSAGNTFPAPPAFPQYGLGGASNTTMAPWTALVNASGNWFGSSVAATVLAQLSGPLSSIDFSPLLPNGIDSDLIEAGFQGDFSSLVITNSGAQTGGAAYSRIQEAIDLDSDGGVIAVPSGTYSGSVDATGKSVTLAAGASPGLVVVGGDFTLDSDDTLDVDIDGVTTAGTDYDQWEVSGTVTLGGATLNLVGDLTGVNSAFDLVIINNTGGGAIVGTFDSLPNGTAFPALLGASVDAGALYSGGTGNDFTLTTLPEIDVTPNPLSFGTTSLAWLTLTVNNTGDGPLTISSPTITGTNFGDFTVTSFPASAIAPGDSATITVKFQPLAPDGLARTASLAINANDFDEPVVNIALNGTSPTAVTGLSFSTLAGDKNWNEDTAATSNTVRWVISSSTPLATHEMTVKLVDQFGNPAPAGATINMIGNPPVGLQPPTTDQSNLVRIHGAIAALNATLNNAQVTLPANYYNSPNPFGHPELKIVVSVDPVLDADPSNDPLVDLINVTVNNVNDTPSISSSGGSVSLTEDDGVIAAVDAFNSTTVVTVANWATNVHAGGSLTYQDPEAFTLEVTNNGAAYPAGAFSSPPTLVATAVPGTYNLTFTLNPDVNTSMNLRPQISTATPAQSVNGSNRSLSITAVNDRPVLPLIKSTAAEIKVLEDSSAQTVLCTDLFDVASFAAINRGGLAGNEQAQSLAFTVTNDNPALFFTNGQPAISGSTGNLTFTPRTDAFGETNVTVTLSDGSSNVSPSRNSGNASRTFKIIIRPVNDTPSYTFVSPKTQTVDEDTGLVTVPIIASDSGGGTTGSATFPPVLSWDYTESSDALTYSVTLSNASLFSGVNGQAPSIDSSGVLTFRPGRDQNGSCVVTVSVTDNGTSYLNANDLAPSADPKTFPAVANSNHQFTINVTSRNDQPVFTITGNTAPLDPEVGGATDVSVSVNEDSGAYGGGAGFIASWQPAARVATSASDEGTQTVANYVVTNSNNALFSAQPDISNTGTLTFTPAANQSGTATVTVITLDNGSGSSNGNPDPTVVTQDDRGSAPQTFTITVDPYNDGPQATFNNAALTRNEDTGSYTTSAWLSSLTVGPGSEAVDFPTQKVTNVEYITRTNSSMLTGVAINDLGGDTNDPANWELAFTPVANEFGTSTVTIRVTDDGPTDVSPPAPPVVPAAPAANQNVNWRYITFTITILNINDAPDFTISAATVTRAEDVGAQSITNFITGRTWGPNEGGQGSVAATAFTVTTDNDALFSVLPNFSGTRTSGNANLNFTPAPDAYGSAVVQVTYNDNGFTGGSSETTGTPDPLTVTKSFTITITPVNDAPSFTLAGNQAVIDDAGPQTDSDFLTNLRLGPLGPLTNGPGPVRTNEEDEQAVDSVTVAILPSPTPDDIFDVAPAISLTYTPGSANPAGVGELTYTPKAGSQGSATIRVTVKDNGGAPGTDSFFQDFVITIHPVPEPITLAATQVQQARAVLNGTLDAKGVETAFVFEYGLASDLSDAVQTAADLINTTGPQPVEMLINNLKANTTYYYRLVATNAFATRRAPLAGNEGDQILSFTTLPSQWTYESGPAGRNTLGSFTSYGTTNPANLPGSRQGAMSWKGSDGQLWVFGGLGYASTSTQSKLNDLWSYNPATGDWVWWKGASTVDQAGVYPPALPVNLTPGARHTCATWTDAAGNLWLFGGFGIGTTRHHDLWKFTVSTKLWSLEKGSSFPNQFNTVASSGPTANPGSRQGAVTWIDADGVLWMFGGYGYGDSPAAINVLNELWNYDPGTGNWTRVAAPTGTPPSARRDAMGWADRSGRFWLFGGLTAFGGANYINDLYFYDPGTNHWTQVDAGVVNGAGSATQPAARYSGLPLTTPGGALLLIGGARDLGPFYNDVWQLDWVSYVNSNFTTNPWVPLTTPNTTGAAIGTLGVGDPANRPGGRFGMAGMAQSDERLLLFAGGGFAPGGLTGRTGDLWSYELSPIPQDKWDEDGDELDDGWELANYGDTTSVDVNSIVTGSLTAGDYELAGLTAAPVPDAFPTFNYNEEFGIPFVDLSSFVPDTTKYTAVYDDDPGPVVVEKELTGTVFNNDSPGPVAPSVSGAAVRILDTSRTLLDKPFQGLYLDDAAQRP